MSYVSRGLIFLVKIRIIIFPFLESFLASSASLLELPHFSHLKKKSKERIKGKRSKLTLLPGE